MFLPSTCMYMQRALMSKYVYMYIPTHVYDVQLVEDISLFTASMIIWPLCKAAVCPRYWPACALYYSNNAFLQHISMPMVYPSFTNCTCAAATDY